MGNIRAEDPKEFAKLEKDVKGYMENTPYPGHGVFQLEKLVLMPKDGTTRLAKAYLKNPDLKIDKMEKTWLANLKQLGGEYGVRVVLDEKYYLR